MSYFKLFYLKSFLILFISISLFFPFPTDASDPLSPWNITVGLPVSLASFTTNTYDNTIFIEGGANSNVIPNNITSTSSIDGSLSNWFHSTSINPPLYWHTSAIFKNHLYILGGTVLGLSGTQSISNPDENGNLEKLGTGVNEFMLPTPANGTYTITLSSTKNDEYTLNEETVEINGDNQFNTTAGILGANGTTSFTLSYLDNATSVYKKAISIQSTIDDVKALYALKEITAGYVENDFINRLESAQKNADNCLVISEAAKLHSLNTLIFVDNATGTVSNYAKQILINDLTTILTSL